MKFKAKTKQKHSRKKEFFEVENILIDSILKNASAWVSPLKI